MARKKTIDPATIELLELAQQKGISTAFDREEVIKPCPIGRDGSCCKHCFMGPCRIVGKTTTGICGATHEVVQARNLTRMIAAGSAAHSDHGRNMALTLLAWGKGVAPGFGVKDEAKLRKIAGLVGVDTDGKSIPELAVAVAEKALEDMSRQEEDGELYFLKRAPEKRQELWRRLGIAPRGIDREVVEAMHRTTMGVDQDPEHILNHALRVALADGWGGSMWATDITDILFSTPVPVSSYSNVGVLKDDHVNVVIHGHEPLLPSIMTEMRDDPELVQYAQSKGAKGINLVGVCCSGNELLMRYGVPLAGNFLQSELIIATGAVEAMVVDYQCIMQGIQQAAEQTHTKIITTSAKARIEGAAHIEFNEHRAPEIAKLILRTAIDNFPNRKVKATIPDVVDPLVAGFSHEYLAYMQGGVFRESFRPLNDAVMQGRIRGGAGVVGCNNPHVTHDEVITTVIKELIKNDVIVLTTGCNGAACAKHGLLTPEVMSYAGPGLREVCEAIGIPPVLHMGSCADNSRILTVLSQMATEGGLGEDISDLPVVGLAPEWMSEKALCIGTYFVASGVYTIFGVGSPVAGSEETARLISQGWESQTGGKLEFETDTDKMIAKTLAHIDAKRAALKLPEYDPSRFAKTESYLPADYLSFEEFRQGKYSLKG